MIIELTTENEIEDLLEYVKEDIANCLYIYVDLKRYGLSNKNMQVWIDKNGHETCLVVMRYHDGFQIYSNQNSWDQEGLVTLIEEYKPERIAGNESVIRALEPRISNRYYSEYGVIFKGRNEHFSGISEEFVPQIANLADIPEIAELLLTEQEFREQYTKAELIGQLEERYRTKMGRSMVIKVNGKIAGHIGTFAETQDVAIISGAVVTKEYRNTDCYAILSHKLSEILCGIEKKNIYFFATNKRLIRLVQRMNELIASYGKLIRKEA